ncbi:Aspartokinase, partial [hydrothermal vent metagenome]
EQESCALMAMAVRELGEEAISLTGGQIGISTDSSHTKARILDIATERMRTLLDAGKIVIAAGFQGVDADKNITTLGRGGSDTTATALAAVLQADECQIYTDVEGVFTTDPRMVKDARKIEQVSYDEMLEMASLGAGVMHSRSIEFAKKYHVPIRVRPAHTEGEGTLITREGESENIPVVTGVALVRNEARVTLCNLPDRPGVMSSLFQKMSERKIAIDMVVQDVSSGGKAEVTFTIPEADLAETLTAAENAVKEFDSGEVHHGTNVSKVSVIGAGMKTHSGVAAQMFQTLANSNVNIQMVTTSEIKISVLVSRDQCDETVNALHAGFALDKKAAIIPTVGSQQSTDSLKGASANNDIERDVVSRLASMEEIVVSEVLLDGEQSRITIANLPDEPGVAKELFTAVAQGGIMVDMIVQNISHSGRADLSFTVPCNALDSCLLLTRGILEKWQETELTFDKNIAKLSVMGIGLRSHTGVGETMFLALSNAGINIQMVNTSEVRISAVIASKHGNAALQVLLDAFGL